MSLPVLYCRTSKGQIQQWEIIVEGKTFYTREGMKDGKLTTALPTTCEGKNIGRANESTPEQQAETEALAKWTKKKKRGYTEDLAGIDSVAYRKPMKGDPYRDRCDEVVYPADYQDKLNGVRFQAEEDGAKSTGGELFHTVPHILDAMKVVYAKWPEAFVDGEAFNPKLRKTLNRLTEIVNVNIKPKDLTPELLKESEQIVQFHVFDGYGFEGITKKTPWRQRHAAVAKLIAGIPYVYILPYKTAKSRKEFETALAEHRKEDGTEGFILRWGDCEYKNGRSKYMLKAKFFEDDEFEIVEVLEGKGNGKGCAESMVLKLHKPATDGRTTFHANVKGEKAWTQKLWHERAQVVGKQATCTYQLYSEYGIPQIPYVIAIRDYE